MTSMRYLRVSRPGAPKHQKDFPEEFIFARDPLTQKEDGSGIPVVSLNQTEFEYDPIEHMTDEDIMNVESDSDVPESLYFSYECFIAKNNDIVGAAMKCGYRPRGRYSKFFNAGMMASRRITPRLRKLSVEEYVDAEKTLKDSVIEHALKASRKARSDVMKKIAEMSSGLSKGDNVMIETIINDMERNQNRLFEQIMGSGEYKNAALKNKVYFIMPGPGKNETLTEHYEKVDDHIKASFIDVVKYMDSVGEPRNLAEDLMEDLYSVISRIGPENSRNYLNKIKVNIMLGNRKYVSDCIYQASNMLKRFDGDENQAFSEIKGLLV